MIPRYDKHDIEAEVMAAAHDGRRVMTLDELAAERKRLSLDHPQCPAGVAVTPEQWRSLIDALPLIPQPGTFGLNPTILGLPVIVARPDDPIPVGYVRLTPKESK